MHLYVVEQLLEEIEGFPLVLYEGIPCGVASEVYTLPEPVEDVEVLPPQGIHYVEQDYPLQLPHSLRVAELPLLILINLLQFLVEGVHQLLLVPHLRYLDLPACPLLQEAGEGFDLPQLGILLREESVHLPLQNVPHELVDLLLEVLPFEDVPPEGVYDLPLGVHNVVVFEEPLPYLEVLGFYPLLSVLDRLGNHSALYGFPLGYLEHLHEPAYPLTAEQSEEVVLEGEDEAGLSGVPLSSGPSPQLVVDPAGFVPLRSYDEESPEFAHLVLLLLRYPVSLLEGALPLLLRSLLGVLSPGSEYLLRKILRIASEEYVRSPPRHVGGYGNRTHPSCLSDDVGFLFMVFGVQNVVGYPVLQDLPDALLHLLLGNAELPSELFDPLSELLLLLNLSEELSVSE